MLALIGYLFVLVGDAVLTVRQVPAQLFVVAPQTFVLALQLTPSGIRWGIR